MRKIIQKTSRLQAVISVTTITIIIVVLLDFLVANVLGHNINYAQDLLRAAIIPLLLAPFVVSQLKDVFLEMDKLEKDKKSLATHDALTGLDSRQTFYTSSEKQHHFSIRNKQAYCILAIDMDGFKKINTENSQACGDKVLKTFGELSQEIARGSDILSRIEGEEFLFFLPKTEPEQAKIFSERLFEKIRKKAVICENKYIKYTISIGIGSNSCKKETSMEETLEKANLALLRAKENGGKSIEYSE